MYVDANKSRERIADEAFKEGTPIATYDIQTKQCTSLAVINFDLSSDALVTADNIQLPDAPEGQAAIFIKTLKTNTAAASENYVDPETASLIRKHKFRLTMADDPDFDPEKQTIYVRDTPYTINIDMVDHEDNVIEDPTGIVLKVKDRDKLCAVSSDLLPYPDNKSFQIKARSSGVACCIRVKDDKYLYVPGLLSLEVLPAKF